MVLRCEELHILRVFKMKTFPNDDKTLSSSQNYSSIKILFSVPPKCLVYSLQPHVSSLRCSFLAIS